MSLEYNDTEKNESSVLKSQLDAEEVVNKLAMNLRCYYYDSSLGKYVKEDINVKPYLNEEGISKMTATLRARISNSNQYSSLSAEQIRAIRQTNSHNNWKVLCVNKKEFNLDITQLSTILDMLDDALHLFLSRTEKSLFQRFMEKIFSSNETYVESNKDNGDKGRGIFGLGR